MTTNQKQVSLPSKADPPAHEDFPDGDDEAQKGKEFGPSLGSSHR